MTVSEIEARTVGAFNEVTGADYQGGNIVRLCEAAIAAGYDIDHGWAGFTQWRTIGRTVRKGEHGTPCLTVVTVDKDENGNGTRKPRGFRVFHFDQTDELPEASIERRCEAVKVIPGTDHNGYLRCNLGADHAGEHQTGWGTHFSL